MGAGTNFMDALRDLAVVAGLFVLRIGLPLTVSLLIGHLLSKLDEKWQADELARQTASTPAKRTAPPCWEVKGCDAAAREACPGYLLRPLPCWLAHRRVTGRLPQRCFTCQVFQAA